MIINANEILFVVETTENAFLRPRHIFTRMCGILWRIDLCAQYILK